MTSADFVVVGSGPTGTVIGRILKEAGCSVVIVERRDHVGGNVHDFVHPSGIRVHTYGPHYFRTNSERIWSFVTGYSDFYPYEAVLASWVDGRFERWPVTEDYIRREVGDDWKPAVEGPGDDFEAASLAMMPESVYTKFVKGYTEKQWGVPARSLSADLAGRFEVRSGEDARLKPHRHQGIPVGGYARFTEALVEGIPVELACDYLAAKDRFAARRAVVFTGPIDEWFGFDLGRLAYRGQKRVHEYLPEVDLAQPYGQVNNPDPANGPHVRTLEWKHMLSAEERKETVGTVLTREIPHSPADPGDYEYPFPDVTNKALYERYSQRARATPGLMVCGRLGEYRYYDMDQAIARAMLLAKRLLGT